MNRPLGSDLKREWVEYAVELEAELKIWQQQSNSHYLYSCDLEKTVADKNERIAELEAALNSQITDTVLAEAKVHAGHSIIGQAELLTKELEAENKELRQTLESGSAYKVVAVMEENKTLREAIQKHKNIFRLMGFSTQEDDRLWAVLDAQK